MSKDLVFMRVIDGVCPICTKDIDKVESVSVEFNGGKVEICKNHPQPKRS